MRAHRITLIEVSAPKSANIEDELKWICRCLDMEPKKDRLAFEIFLHLIAGTKKGEGIKTIDITKSAGVTQAAVVYHMNSFIDSGLAVKKGSRYFLRAPTLAQTISEMEMDISKRMRMLREIANMIDERMI